MPAFETDLWAFLKAQGYLMDKIKTVDDAVDAVACHIGGELDALRERGVIPVKVGTFADLHDHIDANVLGNADEWPGPLPSDQGEEYATAFCDFWEKVHAEVENGL